MNRSCGGCTMCCKVMLIADLDPPKPSGKWCSHCVVAQGCSIYPDRPESCRGFRCLWLQDPIGYFTDDSDRPDRSRCVVTNASPDGTGVLVHVDPDRPDAWRNSKAIRKMLYAAARQGWLALVRIGEKNIVVSEKGEWEVEPECQGGDALNGIKIFIPGHVRDRLGITASN